MARDIEEFLRKAAERRKQQQNQGGGAPAPTNQQSRPPAPPRPQPPRPQPRQEFIPTNEIEVIAPRGESIQDHVRRHINTNDITQHARQLGEEVALADDKIDAHIHQKFDQGLGTLASGRDPYAQDSNNTMNRDLGQHDLLDLLREPKTLRQAILVSEILKRPNFDF